MSGTLMIIDDNISGNFADTGCSVQPSCLSCPLAVCVEDDPVWPINNAAKRLAWDVERAKLYWDTAMKDGQAAGMRAVCAKYEIEERTVYRVLRRAAGYVA